MSRLLHSSKFWTAIIDAAASTLVLLAGTFLDPAYGDLLTKLVITWQPAFLLVIIGTTAEDVASKRQ